MGAFTDSIQAWKRKIQEGGVAGPRVFTPNTFITSVDGPPERAPLIPFPISRVFGGQFAVRVGTPGQVRRAAMRNIRKGADFLKTQYTETSMFYRGGLRNLSDACFLTLKKIAVEYGLKVALHHTESAGFKKGIAHGFNCLEHCALDPLEQKDIEQFVSQGMAIVPTLRVNHSCMEVDEMIDYLHGAGKDDYVPECHRQILNNLESHQREPYPPDNINPYLDVEKSKKGFEMTLENVDRMKKAGAKIGVGSDGFGCHLNLPGYLWKELQLLTQAGFTNFEALRAATAVNAQILGIDRELGTIQPGKLADFIVLNGNPLEDVTSIRNIRMVVKDGEPYREGNLLHR